MKRYIKMFLLAVEAGLAIAIGGTINLAMENKLAGALLFTAGLYTVMLNGLYLYTGKAPYLLAQEKKKPYFFLLGVTWLGNLLGAALTAWGIKTSRIGFLSEAAKEVSGVKLGDSPLSSFIMSFFCGVLVFVAVNGFREKGNPLIIFLCVSVFILCGFEHCVANMFYFTLAGAWSLKTLGYLLLMTLGNSLGGLMMPAVERIKE